jgi:hypothetical protein
MFNAQYRDDSPRFANFTKLSKYKGVRCIQWGAWIMGMDNVLAESEKLGVREVMGILINAGKIGAYLLLTHMTLQIKKMPGFWTSFMA